MLATGAQDDKLAIRNAHLGETGIIMQINFSKFLVLFMVLMSPRSAASEDMRLALYETTIPGETVVRSFLRNDPCDRENLDRINLALHFDIMKDAANLDGIADEASRSHSMLRGSKRHVCEFSSSNEYAFDADVITYFEGTPIFEGIVRISKPSGQDRQVQFISQRILVEPTDRQTDFAEFLDRFTSEIGPLYQMSSIGLRQEVGFDHEAAVRLVDIEISQKPKDILRLEAFKRFVSQVDRFKKGDYSEHDYAEIQAASEAGYVYATNSLFSANTVRLAIQDGINLVEQDRQVSSDMNKVWADISDVIARGIVQGSWTAHDIDATLARLGATISEDGLVFEVYDGPRVEDVERGLHALLSQGRFGSQALGVLATRGQIPPEFFADCDPTWCVMYDGLTKVRFISRGRPVCDGGDTTKICRFTYRLNQQISASVFGNYPVYQKIMTGMHDTTWEEEAAVFQGNGAGGWTMGPMVEQAR